MRQALCVAVHAAKSLPAILGVIAALMAFCGLLAWIVVRATGVGALTAYLATCPGGMDTVAIIAHGHVLRVLGARWLDLPPADGKLFGLGTATLSRLGWEHDYRVIQRWNAPV